MQLWPVDPASVFLAGSAVELMFACTMFVIALSDRRTKGTRWFCGMAALNLLATSFRVWHGHDDRLIWDVRFAALSMLVLVMMHEAVQWFAVRRPSMYRWQLCLTTFVLFVAGIETPLRMQVPAMFVLRVAALVLYGRIVWMLWRPKFLPLQPVMRLTASVIVVQSVLRFVRMLIEVGAFGAVSHETLDHYREAGMTLVMMMELCFVALYVAEMKMRLHDETRIDILTGLKNRRAFEELAQRAVETALARRQPLSMLMLDLDHFKALNDTWGHVVGDRALSLVGAELVQAVGDDMLVARLGGEEFAVLLPGMEMEDARSVADRVRASVASLDCEEEGKRLLITASLGVSALQAGELTWQKMLQRADVALYRAKASGRNRVEICVAGKNPPMPHSREASAWQRMFRGNGPVL